MMRLTDPTWRLVAEVMEQFPLECSTTDTVWRYQRSPLGTPRLYHSQQSGLPRYATVVSSIKQHRQLEL